MIANSPWTEREVVVELSRRGYTEGVDLFFEVRSPRIFTEPSEQDRAARELVQAKVDLILAYGGSYAMAAKRATSTLPIVFIGVPDALGVGLVRNLARPEANLTGSSFQAWDTNAKELQLFAEAVGKLTNLAYFIPGEPPPSATAPLINAARVLGIRIQFIIVKSARELEPLVERLAREGIDGVAVADSSSSDAQKRVAALLIKLRLPSLGNTSAC